MERLQAILDRAAELLAGEPLRAIAYGAAAVIYLVARALGRIEDVSPEQALAQALAGAAVVAGVVETARKYVRPA